MIKEKGEKGEKGEKNKKARKQKKKKKKKGGKNNIHPPIHSIHPEIAAHRPLPLARLAAAVGPCCNRRAIDFEACYGCGCDDGRC